MRRRLWIPVSALLFALAAVVFTGWYRSPEVQTKIRTFLERQIAGETKGKVHIGSFKIGLLSITAGDIALDIPADGAELSVEKIRIGFSLDALFHRKWTPAELIDRITVIRPSVILTISEDSNPKPLPALSVREMIPFRTAAVSDASVTVRSPGGTVLFSTRGLTGTVIRRNTEADITLNASVGSFTENTALFLHLSDRIEERRMSIRVKELNLKEFVRTPDLDIRGKASASIETSFREGVFPHNLVPKGEISVSGFSVRQKKNLFCTRGEIRTVLDGDSVRFEKISAFIPGGTLSAAAAFKLGTEKIHGSGSADIELNGQGPIPPAADLSGMIHAEFSVPNLAKRYIPVDLISDLTVQGEQFTAQGAGAVTARGVDLKTVQLNTKYGTVSGKASYLDGTAEASGEALVAYEFKRDFRIDGAFPFELNLPAKAKLPNFTIRSRSAVLSTPQGTVPLPDLTAQSFGESLTIAGKNSEMALSLFTEKYTDPLKKYSGTAAVFPAGTARALTMAKKSGVLQTASVSAEFSGKEGETTFHGTLSAETKSEKVKLFTTGIWGKKRQELYVDQGIFSRSGYDFPFTALIRRTAEGWESELAAVSGKFVGQGLFTADFDSLSAFAANISQSELTQLNAFLPESDFPVKAGTFSASLFASGPIDSVQADGYVDIDAFSIGGLDSIRTSLKMHWQGTRGTVDPFSITRLRQTMITSDTIYFGDTASANLELVRLDIGRFLSELEGEKITGTAAGSIHWDSSGLSASLRSPALRRGAVLLDSIEASAKLHGDTLILDSLAFSHVDTRAKLSLTFPLKDRLSDTLHFSFRAAGDLLKSAGQFKESPIGGTGKGLVTIDGSVSSGEWNFTTARAVISGGSAAVYPYVRGTLDHFYADLKLIRKDSIALTVRGDVENRWIILKNDYRTNGLTPMIFGDLNFGVMRVYTEEGGVPLFIPGFQENRKGNVGWIETAGKDSIPALTLSGTPPDDFLVTGTLLLRKAEITFPLLMDVEWPTDFDPFPMVGFDLDIQAADRSITYFYQLGGQKKRRALRLLEASIDPSHTIGVRGRAQDGDFRVTGGIRAYKGFLFYGKMFDQNFELGLDFSSGKTKGEHDNLPVIWASAETYSDTNRLDRSEVVLMTKDLETGELVRRGRLTELVVVPASGAGSENSSLDEQSAEFYRSTGKEMTNIAGAGSTISGLGDVYVNSFLFNYWGRQAARKLGLDLMRLETSVMSNAFSYLYDYQTDSAFQRKWTQLAFSNMGLTVGKYVADDQVLLKMRSQIGTVRDTVLVPELKLGLEYQPLRYLWMDLNYGIKRDLETSGIILNPELRIQLRMPFSRIESTIRNR